MINIIFDSDKTVVVKETEGGKTTDMRFSTVSEMLAYLKRKGVDATVGDVITL